MLAAVEALRRAGIEVMFFARWDDAAIAGNGQFDPDFIVLHHTAGVSSYGGLATGVFGDHVPVPGANFLVNRSGSLWVLTRFVAYHAGRGRGFGVPDNMMNQRSWGIEIEDLGRAQTMTEEQVRTTSMLSAELLRGMERPVTAVINHRDWSTTGKPDTLYPIEFWRTRVERHLTSNEEDDMALTDKMKVPTWARDLLGVEEITGEELLIRTLAAVLRSERKEAARGAGLAAAVAAVNSGASAEQIAAAVDTAVAKYLGGPVSAEVSINVAPPAPAPEPAPVDQPQV